MPETPVPARPVPRRSFERTTLAGVLLLACGAAAPGSPDLAMPERIVWGFRDGVPFNQPRGIAIDGVRGEVVVANTGAHRIEIFSLAGRPLERMVHRVRAADGSWRDGLPRCVAIAADGSYLVADNLASAISVLDRRGRVKGTLEPSFRVSGSASALHVSRTGDVWVGGPPRDDRVHRFDASLDSVSVWGESGAAAGSLKNITAITTLPDGDVAVACAGTELAIQIFSPDGTFRFGFGVHDLGPGNFSLPSGIAATDDGRLWISDEIRQNVQVFDLKGTYIGAFGGKGLGPSDFLYPSALASDRKATVAVAEREAGRIQIFSVIGGGEGSEPKPQ
ncbi:MAG TPA: NHL repeat-containing protein [Candidatus Eisenbacteria bacterium]|nr:NHL repeat-containing protein [Candidatus Eisenbacteria bacterium]